MPVNRDPARGPLSARVGDELVVLDEDHAYVLEPGLASEYERSDSPTRRQILARAGAVGVGAGIAMVALPMAAAHASLTAGLQTLTTVSPASGPRGQTITVSGTGFFPNGTITTFTIGGLTVVPSSTSIDATGAFTVTAVVPDGAGLGLNTILVTDNHNNTASNKSYNVVAPTVTINPASWPKHTGGGNGSQAFTIATASGFAPTSALTVAIVDNLLTLTGGPTTTNGTGGVTTSGTYTATYINGAYTAHIKVTDSHNNTVTIAIVIS